MATRKKRDLGQWRIAGERLRSIDPVAYEHLIEMAEQLVHGAPEDVPYDEAPPSGDLEPLLRETQEIP